MAFELKAKTYDWRHILGLPFACEPLCTAGVVAQKCMTGLVNVLWVLVEAKFLNLAVLCAMGQARISDTYPWLAAMIGIIAWKRMGYSFGRLLTRRIQISSQYQMSRETVKKRSRLHYSLIEDKETWELCNRISKDMGNDIWSMLQQTCNFFVAVIRILGVFLIIFTQSIWMGILMMLVSVPLLCLSVKSGGRIYQAFRESSAYARKSDYLQKLLTDRESVEERTLFAWSDHINLDWNMQRDRYQEISVRAEREKELRNAGSNILTNTVSTLAVVFLIWELSRGTISIGIFIALSKAVYDMVGLMSNEIGRSVVSMARYVEYMKDLTVFANLLETAGTNDLPSERNTPPTERNILSSERNILPSKRNILPPKRKEEFESLKLEHVSFRYPGSERYILKDMSMELEKGTHYAFVGENGAGKTTVIKLLTGLYDNYEGSILLNGRELKEYSPAELKAMFSNVWQDFARYQDTAANNILIGDILHMEEPASRERMEQYAKDLDIWQELSGLSDGFDTHLGRLMKGGVELSGGQWQRIAMARSLMNPAPIQILDEPTAALDPISESRLYEEFERISRGRTTVFISHRLGSTKLADRIFVLQDGKVAQKGSHESLMRDGGLYREMYESQRSWYANESETEKKKGGAGA